MSSKFEVKSFRTQKVTIGVGFPEETWCLSLYMNNIAIMYLSVDWHVAQIWLDEYELKLI